MLKILIDYETNFINYGHFYGFYGLFARFRPYIFQKNGISLNASSLLYQGLAVTYERGIQPEIGVGLSSLLFVYQKIKDEGQNFHITPYARYYFGKKPLGGFFVEGFAIQQKLLG